MRPYTPRLFANNTPMPTQRAAESAPRARIVDTITGLDPVQWDGLVGEGNFYNSFRWLQSLELANGAAPAVVANRRGDLAGAIPFRLGPSAGLGADSLFHLRHFFSDVAGPWEGQFLWLGGRRAVFNDLICEPGGGRRDTLAAMLACATEHVRETGLTGVVAPYVPVESACELAACHPDAHVLLHDADAAVPVPHSGLAGLMSTASRADRKEWRREMRAFATHGNRVEWAPLTADVTAAAAPLIAQTRARYGNRDGPEPLLAAFDAQRVSGLADSGIAALCYEKDRLVGVGISYGYGNQLYERYVGFDYERLTPSFQYFNIGYYEPIQWAAAHEFRLLRLTVSAADAKVKRGARLHPLAAVVVLNGAQLDACAVEAHNRATESAWRKRFPRHRSALEPQWHQAAARCSVNPYDACKGATA